MTSLARALVVLVLALALVGDAAAAASTRASETPRRDAPRPRRRTLDPRTRPGARSSSPRRRASPWIRWASSGPHPVEFRQHQLLLRVRQAHLDFDLPPTTADEGVDTSRGDTPPASRESVVRKQYAFFFHPREARQPTAAPAPGNAHRLASSSHGHTLSSISHCFQKGTSSCAADHPCAATEGTPGPGKLESPTASNPSSGVDAVVMGTVSDSGPIHPVPPYVPLCRLWNLCCVSGVPTKDISTRSRTSGMAFSPRATTPANRSSLSAALGRAPLESLPQIQWFVPGRVRVNHVFPLRREVRVQHGRDGHEHHVLLGGDPAVPVLHVDVMDLEIVREARRRRCRGAGA